MDLSPSLITELGSNSMPGAVSEVVRTAAPVKSAVTFLPARLHGLDTLRGLAAVLVVLLHAGIPYMLCPFPYLVWPARDANPCSIVDAITWCSECFIMPVFFVLGGFFSAGMLANRSDREFIAGRTMRLFVTSFAAGITVLPACLCIWALGWMADGLYVPDGLFLLGIPPELEAELYGVAHIWFLQNLYLYCLGLCFVRWLSFRYSHQIRNGLRMLSLDEASDRLRREGDGLPDSQLDEVARLGWWDRWLVSFWKPVLLAAPCALILYWDTRIVLGFYQSFIPVLSKLVYYSVYFTAGVLLDRHRSLLSLHARFGLRYLILAGILFMTMLPLIHEHTIAELSGARRALLVTQLALFAALVTFGLIGIFLKFNRRGFASTCYLAEASYWVYLVHLPFVTLTQVAIAPLPIPAVAKFAMVGATAMAISLLTYHVFVRETCIGVLLNGCRRTKKTEPVIAAPAQTAPLVACSV